VIATIPVKGNNPSDVTVGLGAVWVAQIDSKSIARIDPKTNKETEEIGLQNDSPLDITTGFGSVWVPIADGNFIDRVKP
jgi:streptogramin lyase